MFLSPFPYGNHHMETGNRFIQLPIWKGGSPYGNGDFQGMCKSPFPYGDHHMEAENRFTKERENLDFLSKIWGKILQCVTWRSPKIGSPFPYGESPYGNGQGESNIPIWGVPVSE